MAARSTRRRTAPTISADQLLQAARAPIYAVDPGGAILFANDAFLETLGYPAGVVIGASHHETLRHARPDGTLYDADRCAMCATVSAGAGTPIAGDVIHTADGSAVAVEYTSAPVVETGTVVATVVTLRELARGAGAGLSLMRTALADSLTDLPNRRGFLDYVERATSPLDGRLPAPYAVLVADLDAFRAVNESVGLEAGDELLVAAAARLHETIRPSDAVGRIGGDEFAVFCPGLRESGDAAAIADRIVEAFNEPFLLAAAEVFATVSVGVAFAEPTSSVEAVLRDAATAAAWAKRRGRARVVAFDSSMRAASIRRVEVERGLRVAMEEGHLRVHFQPKVSLRTRRIVGMEALLRWEHPTRGMLPPYEFIPVAEESGLIVPIGAWVIEEACRLSSAWRAERKGGHLLLAVNLSGRQLLRPDLPATVLGALDETGTHPSQLCLEITESVLMDDVDAAVAAMTKLKAIGVQLAIDDFGTGHSSFSYLQQFPADILKIDKSFVDGLGRTVESQSIVSSVIGLAHSLGLSVVAEGVEQADQASILGRLSCDLAQGYFFGRPMEPDAIGELILADARLGGVDENERPKTVRRATRVGTSR